MLLPLQVSNVLQISFTNLARTSIWLHVLIEVLKLSANSLFFKLCGRLSHIFGPKYLMLSKPKLTLLTLGIIKSLIFLKL